MVHNVETLIVTNFQILHDVKYIDLDIPNRDNSIYILYCILLKQKLSYLQISRFCILQCMEILIFNVHSEYFDAKFRNFDI